MPESRKRKGHPYRQPSDIPAKQRTTGHTLWAVLFAVFALIIAFFAAGDNLYILIGAAIAGAFIGYLTGRTMEKDASHK